MTTKIQPFKTPQEVKDFFDNWNLSPHEGGSNKPKLCPRLRNEFISLYFKNTNQDLFTVRLNWENPNPMKWYINLFYDRNNFPEMFDLLASNTNQGVLTIEVDLGYAYPFRPPKMTLMTFKYHIGETPIKNGKIKSDGSIEHHSLRELSDDELSKELANKKLDSNDPQNWGKVHSWCPAINLCEIIVDLYLEIAISYHRYGRLMFY